MRENLRGRSSAKLSGAGRKSQFAEGEGDGEAGGAHGGEQAADEADGRGPDNSLRQQLRGDAEGKGDLAKALEVHGGGVKAVEGKISQRAANDAADEREDQ